MYVLGIDTSTRTGGVALLKSGNLVGESVLNIRSTHSERLLPALEQLLVQGEVSGRDLTAVAVVTGPGSFTGLRIGVATAKGLTYALGHTLLGVTTLEAYGWQFRFFPGVVIPLIDASRGLVYAQAFSLGKALLKAGNWALGEVLNWSAQLEEECLFVGDGAFHYREEIAEAVPQASFPPEALGLLRPAAVASLGYARLLKGQKDDVLTLNPTYLRKTEAEIRWQERK